MDEKFRKLQRAYQCQPSDTEAAAAYIHILEQRVLQPVLGTISLQQVGEETDTAVLQSYGYLAENIATAAWARIAALHAACNPHDIDESLSGDYSSSPCTKCGYIVLY
jgi:hypothetical protein